MTHVHVYNLDSVRLERPSLVTIGVFDGVHRGHQFLIRQLVQTAHSTEQLAVVLTLFPHPDVVLRGLTGRYYLTTPNQQADLLGALGVDYVVTQPFDDTTRHIRAAAFVDRLLTHLKMAGVWITADFALGYQREGNFTFLQMQGALKGFTVRESPLLTGAGGAISSSAIRAALVAGDVQQATDGLGRPYAVVGPVVHGDHRGRTIGFPTANVEVWAEQIIPANGVYAGYAHVGDEHFRAVMNIGQRPTFSGTDVRVEAYLPDFDRDIYSQIVTIDFVARLRAEQKFSGIDALKAQIRADVARALAVLNDYEQTLARA